MALCMFIMRQHYYVFCDTSFSKFGQINNSAIYVNILKLKSVAAAFACYFLAASWLLNSNFCNLYRRGGEHLNMYRSTRSDMRTGDRSESQKGGTAMSINNVISCSPYEYKRSKGARTMHLHWICIACMHIKLDWTTYFISNLGYSQNKSGLILRRRQQFDSVFERFIDILLCELCRVASLA